MKNCLKYHDPLTMVVHETKCDYEAWQGAIEAHKEGQFIDSFKGMLKYYNPKAIDVKEGEEVELAHGSLKLYVKFDKEKFTMRAPFLKMPEKISAALLRKISEINMSELVLAQIRMRENMMVYEYSDRIELSHPGKLAGLINEICISGDFYDDIFIEKFKAEPINTSNFNFLPPDQVKINHQAIQEILAQMTEYMDDFIGKRQETFALDVACAGFHHLYNTVEPQGLLGSMLNQAIDNIVAPVNIMQRLESAKKTIKEIQAYDEKKVGESLYESEFFLPLRKMIGVREFQDFIGRSYSAADHERRNNDFKGSTLSLWVPLNMVLFRYQVPMQISTVVQAALKQASERPWKESSDILFQTITPLMSEQMAMADEMMDNLGRVS